MHHSKSYVPNVPGLGYDPADDQVAINSIPGRLDTVTKAARSRGAFCSVELRTPASSGSTFLCIELPRVTLRIRLDRIEQAWIILARALEFEIRARPGLRLSNPQLIGSEAA